MSKKDKSKKSIDKSKNINKKVIGVVISVFIILVLVGFFFYKNMITTKIKESWGETYYLYLKDVNNSKKLEEKAGLDKNSSKTKLNFYEVNGVKEPVMVVSYKKKDINYSNVYYIEDKRVNTIIYNEPTVIEFLYNIEKKEYDYYFHIEKDGKDYYQLVGEVLKDKEKQPEYSFEKGKVESAITDSGEEITVNKFDTVFVLLDIIKDKGVDYNTNLSNKELLEVINKTISEYKKSLNIVDKDIEESVTKRVEEVSSKLETIKSILEEEEKKRNLENVKNKLMGIWKHNSSNLVMSITVERGMLIYKYGMYATGSSDYGKIQSIENVSDNIYRLVIYDEGCLSDDCIEERESRTFSVDVDATDIDNRNVVMENDIYNYVGKDFNEAQKAFGY